MSRVLVMSTLMLLSYGHIFAEDHHDREKRDTHVTIVTDDKHHDHCEQKRSLGALCLQLNRKYIRIAAAIGAASFGYASSSDAHVVRSTLIGGYLGFTVGHLLKQITKLTMYLNNIPKK